MKKFIFLFSIFLLVLTSCMQNTTPTYKIHFDPAEGTGTMEPQFFNTYGEITLNASTFTRTGYSFIGWNYEGGATVQIKDNGKFSDPFEGLKTDITLTAIWEEGYIITFDANRGSGTMDPQKIMGPSYEAMLTKNEFVRDGYYFVGWSTSRDNPAIVAVDGANYTATKEITLYAQWRD